MSCSRCGGLRVASISAKCDDRCSVRLGERHTNDYVPYDMGIGGGDYVKFSWCLDCGTIQDIYRLPLCEMEQLSETDS